MITTTINGSLEEQKAENGISLQGDIDRGNHLRVELEKVGRGYQKT